MTRPQMVRADTIDLQDHSAPSAQNHKHLQQLGAGRPAPHQEQALRRAEEEAREELSNSPRVSLDRFDLDEQSARINIALDGAADAMADMADAQHDYAEYQVNEESGVEGDTGEGADEDLLDDDLMDKISSSPSIDDEDIDFEFVYALHTFVATVEGQANATKGDTMVLLDDSNSYWWLVRIVKDGSIGYLPAEHIETPTERLARLNKHRNIDLTATMLGDNPEKSKNPLKKAMRRRNAKTVTFSAPTYFEASDVDYSTDEEQEGDNAAEPESSGRSAENENSNDIQDEDMVVEPLRPKPKEKAVNEPEPAANDMQSDRPSMDNSESSNDVSEKPAEHLSRSRNGTLRNTDSFFKDDTVETKKISLTPNLLRDDIDTNTNSESGRASLESLDKVPSGEKSKRKDKKSGMFSGLFKRKDKKGKGAEEDYISEDAEKSSLESMRGSPQHKGSMESLQENRNAKSGPHKQLGKLQKQPPPEVAQPRHGPQDLPSPTSSPIKEEFGSSIRQVVSPPTDGNVAPLSVRSQQPTPEHGGPGERDWRGSDTPSLSKRSSPTGRSPSKLDDIAEEEEMVRSPTEQTRFGVSASHLDAQRWSPPHDEPRPESPINVHHTPVESGSQPPGLVLDTSSQEDRSISSSSSSPSPEDAGADTKGDGTTPVSTESSGAASTWSDASLRSWLDDENNDIRDLVIIVHDKSNVQPAGPDHPITGSLFKEESRRLKEMSGRLDEMLAAWVGRKMERRQAK